MKVEVISNGIIKPSSPTPDHLHRYKLSFLDQLSPSIYNPFIYLYALNDTSESNIVDISQKLKKSLSQVLTLYYPLAGRFTNDNLVDCNDDGILFLEARVLESQLSDVRNNHVQCEVLNKLLPFPLDEITELPLGVQLNIFESGGIAIGVCISHRIADALSCLIFIRSWMAIARGEEAVAVRPEFVSADLFPPSSVQYDPNSYISKLNTTVTKRFVFEAPIIEALRSKCDKEIRTNEENNIKRPSRVEAVSAFIWSRFVAVTKVESEPTKFYTVHHAVNLRPKFNPPLPEHSFGNYYRTSTTVIPSFISNLGNLAKEMGEDVKNIDKGFVEKLRSQGDEFLASLKKGTNNGFIKGEVVPLAFTSLCRFPLYEADFGWGKPSWVGSAARCFKNLVGYMDDKTGRGIEAYICLKPEDMAKLEDDNEFLALVSPN